MPGEQSSHFPRVAHCGKHCRNVVNHPGRGATFRSARLTLGPTHPVRQLRMLRGQPQFWDALRDDTTATRITIGRKRLPGHWALAFVALRV